MKPHEQVKSAGLKSLVEVSRLTKVQTQTLRNWSKNKIELFKIVILGCSKAKEKAGTSCAHSAQNSGCDSKSSH